MIPFFLLSPETQKRIRENEAKRRKARQELINRRLKEAKPWDLWFKWDSIRNNVIAFQADTYKPELIFDTPAVGPSEYLRAKEPLENDIVVPLERRSDMDEGRSWVYRNLILPKGEALPIYLGSRQAQVAFDGDVVVPVLYEFRPWVTWDNPFVVWMGISPMEMITQRAGIKHCTGNVCVGGFGLGWFTEQVAMKRSVKSITVVEASKKLIDWFAKRRIKEFEERTGKEIKLVHGDVYKYLIEDDRHARFDKIALDVFEKYGNNNVDCCADLERLMFHKDHRPRWRPMPRINPKKVWCWGAASISQEKEFY